MVPLPIWAATLLIWCLVGEIENKTQLEVGVEVEDELSNKLNSVQICADNLRY